jgi:hypothetical protein
MSALFEDDPDETPCEDADELEEIAAVMSKLTFLVGVRAAKERAKAKDRERKRLARMPKTQRSGTPHERDAA